jgi:hypothetical protein
MAVAFIGVLLHRGVCARPAAGLATGMAIQLGSTTSMVIGIEPCTRR